MINIIYEKCSGSTIFALLKVQYVWAQAWCSWITKWWCCPHCIKPISSVLDTFTKISMQIFKFYRVFFPCLYVLSLIRCRCENIKSSNSVWVMWAALLFMQTSLDRVDCLWVDRQSIALHVSCNWNGVLFFTLSRRRSSKGPFPGDDVNSPTNTSIGWWDKHQHISANYLSACLDHTNHPPDILTMVTTSWSD